MRTAPKTFESPVLSLQEQVLATGALHKLGSVTTSYSIDGNGGRYFTTSLTDADFTVLHDQFRDDPKTSLAFMRDNLFAIGRDRNLSKNTRHDRLSRYLDSYTSLTVKLDHAAFSDDGAIHTGVPDYIPDGFIDMGQESHLNPQYRSREQILVDKAAIYKKYKNVLMGVFSSDMDGLSNTDMKMKMATTLLLEVYRTMPYDYQLFDGSKRHRGIVPLNTLDSGVCRHIALTYQVLAQSCGLTSRLVKCHVNDAAHAMNATRINNQWFFTDPTIPDYTTRPDGTKVWEPGVYSIGHKEPKPGDAYTIKAHYSGEVTRVALRGNMFWRIAKP